MMEIHANSRPTSRGKRFMQNVLNLINKSSYDERFKQSKHAAIIMRGGNIIGYGINVYKPHPMSLKRDVLKKRTKCIEDIYTMHAEMAAIRSVKNKELLNGATIFIGRLSDSWGEMFSCPCETCTFYIQKYKLKRVVYTSNPGEWREFCF